MTRAERDDLVLSNRWLARFIARRIAAQVRNRVSVEDLEQEAMVALLEVAERYDRTTGVPFSAFARFRITGRLRDHIRGQDILSRSARSKVRCLARASDDLLVELEREPTEVEVAERLGWSVEAVRRFKAYRAAVPVSLDEPLSPDDGTGTRLDFQPSRAASIEDRILDAEAAEHIHGAIDRLPRRERVVMRGRLDSREVRVIGRDLGVSESRVSQLNSSARCRLRAELRSWV